MNNKRSARIIENDGTLFIYASILYSTTFLWNLLSLYLKIIHIRKIHIIHD